MRLPNDTPELAIGLLLDESGSMGCGSRATYARAAAIILYDFCQSLHIPVMVYGHSTDDGVALYSYAEFDSIDQLDRYRMMDISARGSNRDGAALRFVAEQLAKRSEDIRLLILVSDGQPADAGYYGTAAEEDLRGIKAEYRRKGICFVAAAIGDDKDNMEDLWRCVSGYLRPAYAAGHADECCKTVYPHMIHREGAFALSRFVWRSSYSLHKLWIIY